MPQYKVKITKQTYLRVKVLTKQGFLKDKTSLKAGDISNSLASFHRHPDKFPIVGTICLIDKGGKRIDFDTIIHECTHIGIRTTEHITKFCNYNMLKIRKHLDRVYNIDHQVYCNSALMQEIITYPVGHISMCVIGKLTKRGYKFGF